MKRIVSVLISVSLIFSFASCSYFIDSVNDSPENKQEEGYTATDYFSILDSVSSSYSDKVVLNGSNVKYHPTSAGSKWFQFENTPDKCKQVYVENKDEYDNPLDCGSVLVGYYNDKANAVRSFETTVKYLEDNFNFSTRNTNIAEYSFYEDEGALIISFGSELIDEEWDPYYDCTKPSDYYFMDGIYLLGNYIIIVYADGVNNNRCELANDFCDRAVIQVPDYTVNSPAVLLDSNLDSIAKARLRHYLHTLGQSETSRQIERQMNGG